MELLRLAKILCRSYSQYYENNRRSISSLIAVSSESENEDDIIDDDVIGSPYYDLVEQDDFVESDAGEDDFVESDTGEDFFDENDKGKDFFDEEEIAYDPRSFSQNSQSEKINQGREGDNENIDEDEEKDYEDYLKRNSRPDFTAIDIKMVDHLITKKGMSPHLFEIDEKFDIYQRKLNGSKNPVEDHLADNQDPDLEYDEYGNDLPKKKNVIINNKLDIVDTLENKKRSQFRKYLSEIDRNYADDLEYNVSEGDQDDLNRQIIEGLQGPIDLNFDDESSNINQYGESLTSGCINNLVKYLETGDPGEKIYIDSVKDIEGVIYNIYTNDKFEKLANKIGQIINTNQGYLSASDRNKPMFIASILTDLLIKSGCSLNKLATEALLTDFVRKL
jgi:hypothetical protein